MTSKIRITLAALAAAFAVAAPIAQAEDSIHPLTVDQYCSNKWDQFAAWTRLASEADASGDAGSRDYYLDQATNAKNDAQDAGCDWARRATVDPLGGGRVGDNLSIQQPTDSTTTGPDQGEAPETGQSETPETVNPGADTHKHKHHKHKHHKHRHHRHTKTK